MKWFIELILEYKALKADSSETFHNSYKVVGHTVITTKSSHYDGASAVFELEGSRGLAETCSSSERNDVLAR